MSANHQSDPAPVSDRAQPTLDGHERAEELRKLLEITAELGTTGDLDEFFQKFVLRAAQFLNFERAFIAVIENAPIALRCAGASERRHFAPKKAGMLPAGTCVRAAHGREKAPVSCTS